MAHVMDARHGSFDCRPNRRIAKWPTLDVTLPLCLLVAAGVALSLDFTVGRWATSGACPGFLRGILDATEPFGDGKGVALIILAVAALDWPRRRAIPRLLTVAYGSALAADIVKLLVERTRPHLFNYEGTIADSFGGLFPLFSVGSSGQSFPSAHTAAAVGLAAGLIWLYPQGRLFFIFMAALVAMQRVSYGVHFVSDTLVGAAIACLVASVTLRHGRLAAWFDRFEARTTHQRPSMAG